MPKKEVSVSARILQYISGTVDQINRALEATPSEEPKIVLKRLCRPRRTNAYQQHIEVREYSAINNTYGASREIVYRWPGNTVDEAWRFSCLLAILSEINCAIHNGCIVTKRDIYYRHARLFRKQDVVDRYIDDIAFTCGVMRHDLNVVASPKALMCGLQNTTTNQIHQDYQGGKVHLVPTSLDSISLAQLEGMKWILVVEKEATFKTLIDANFEQNCTFGPGLLITAKGYPDLSTLLFLRHLVQIQQQTNSTIQFPIPMFTLTDCDPDGLEIHRCYNSCPQSLAAIHQHEPSLQLTWLGIDMTKVLGTKSIMDKSLVMTGRDRAKAMKMLHFHNGIPSPSRSCLQTMLMLNVKLEIQAVEVIAWLKTTMHEHFPWTRS